MSERSNKPVSRFICSLALPIALSACDRIPGLSDDPSREPRLLAWTAQTISPSRPYAIQAYLRAKCDQEQLRYEFSIMPTTLLENSPLLKDYPLKVERRGHNDPLVVSSDVPFAYYLFENTIPNHVALQQAAMMESVNAIATFHADLIDRDGLQIYAFVIPRNSMTQTPDEHGNAMRYSLSGIDKCEPRLFAHVANWTIRWVAAR